MIPSTETLLNYAEHSYRFYSHFLKGIGYMGFSSYAIFIYAVFLFNCFMIYMSICNLVKVIPHVINIILNIPYFIYKTRKMPLPLKTFSLGTSFDKIFGPIVILPPGKIKFRDTYSALLAVVLKFVMGKFSKIILIPLVEIITRPKTHTGALRTAITTVSISVTLSLIISCIWIYGVACVTATCLNFMSFLVNQVVSLSMDVNEISKEVMIFKWF